MHLENKMENYVKHEWEYELYLSGLSSNKRGVMTLVNNNFEQEVGKVIRDPNGNYLEITIQKEKKLFWQMCMDQMRTSHNFFKNLKQKTEEFNNEWVIIS